MAVPVASVERSRRRATPGRPLRIVGVWCLLAGLLLAGDGLIAQARGLSSTLRQARAARVEVGFHAVDLRSGEVLGSTDADEALIPASNQKLLTVAAFLSSLGPEHRFHTGFDVVDGHLVVRAGGDPNWRTGGPHDPAALFAALAARLRAVGVSNLRGVSLDRGPFRGPDRPDGWPEDQYERAYCAPTGAALLDAGCWVAELSVPAGGGAAAQVDVLSPPGGLPLIGRIPLTSDKKKGGVYGLAAVPEGLKIWGRFWNRAGQRRHRGAVTDAEAAFVSGLRHTLQTNRVLFSPTAPANVDPVRLPGLDTGVEGTLQRVLKESSNNDAEMLLRNLGAELRADGSFSGGAAATRDALHQLVGRVPHDVAIVDGSGLSRGDRVTARYLVEVLRAARRSDWWPTFQAALPYGTEPGTTLRRRFRGKSWARTVRAKTGTINGVSALSGYCVDEDGREIAFAILMNWQRRKAGTASPHTLQERLVEALVTGRDS